MYLVLKNSKLDFCHRSYIMGILNVTPDSFSDGGQFVEKRSILSHVQEMIGDGADIIDVGGESTRPFANPVSEEEELSRVIPAIQAIRKHSSIPISIDTTKSTVAAQALEAGADIINDISALRFDPRMADIANTFKAPVIIMHMQGKPSDMQISPHYDSIIEETLSFFKERIDWLENQGISKDRIVIDPGIGFGKTLAHNLLILNRVNDYSIFGCPVLIGHSRKSFIGKILEDDSADRDSPTAILSGILAAKHVSILRVHDVKKTHEALKISQALVNAC
nr:dihydropteroate synthase [Desulfobulbaceae bacterium]